MSELYDRDFHAWAAEQGALLRAGQLSAADVEHIAEEIESMGRAVRNELTNRLAVLLVHLLKWRFQSNRRSRSSELTIRERRRQAGRVLAQNPSLRPHLDAIVADAYGDAVLAAARETGQDDAVFPVTCPWSFDQALQGDLP